MEALLTKITFPLWFAIYQYSIIFVISGITKIVDPKPLIKMFPALPVWFWFFAGIWELG